MEIHTFFRAYTEDAGAEYRRKRLTDFARAFDFSAPEAVGLMRVAVEAEDYGMRLLAGFGGRLRNEQAIRRQYATAAAVKKELCRLCRWDFDRGQRTPELQRIPGASPDPYLTQYVVSTLRAGGYPTDATHDRVRLTLHKSMLRRRAEAQGAEFKKRTAQQSKKKPGNGEGDGGRRERRNEAWARFRDATDPNVRAWEREEAQRAADRQEEPRYKRPRQRSRDRQRTR